MQFLKRLSTWLYTISTGWVALASLIIFLLFTGFILPAQGTAANETSGEIGSPDTSFFYTPYELFEMAEAYGEQGRTAYIRARFTFDLIWPLIYTIFLSTTISWSYEKAFTIESRWRLANLAPPLGMFFDYAENISTAIVMYRYPILTNSLATLAPILTVTKWIFVTGGFVLLFIGIIVGAFKSHRKSLGGES